VAHTAFYNSVENLVEMAYTGPGSLEEMYRGASELVALAGEHDCHRWLIDFSDFPITGLNPSKMVRFSEDLAKILEPLGSKKHRVRRAIVITYNEPNIRFLETTSYNRAQNLKVFDNRQSAIEWLLGSGK
jgi:hypothetical protein